MNKLRLEIVNSGTKVWIKEIQAKTKNLLRVWEKLWPNLVVIRWIVVCVVRGVANAEP